MQENEKSIRVLPKKYYCLRYPNGVLFNSTEAIVERINENQTDK